MVEHEEMWTRRMPEARRLIQETIDKLYIIIPEVYDVFLAYKSMFRKVVEKYKTLSVLHPELRLVVSVETSEETPSLEPTDDREFYSDVPIVLRSLLMKLRSHRKGKNMNYINLFMDLEFRYCKVDSFSMEVYCTDLFGAVKPIKMRSWTIKPLTSVDEVYFNVMEILQGMIGLCEDPPVKTGDYVESYRPVVFKELNTELDEYVDNLSRALVTIADSYTENITLMIHDYNIMIDELEEKMGTIKHPDKDKKFTIFPFKNIILFKYGFDMTRKMNFGELGGCNVPTGYGDVTLEIKIERHHPTEVEVSYRGVPVLRETVISFDDCIHPESVYYIETYAKALHTRLHKLSNKQSLKRRILKIIETGAGD